MGRLSDIPLEIAERLDYPAELGYCTLWFAAVLDGAAVLGTLLMAIRAFGFDKQHHRVRDYLPKIKSE